MATVPVWKFVEIVHTTQKIRNMTDIGRNFIDSEFQRLLRLVDDEPQRQYLRSMVLENWENELSRREARMAQQIDPLSGGLK